MKVLIWILCAFVYGLITTLITTAGITLGAIPAILLAGGTFLLARFLCRKWDKRS